MRIEDELKFQLFSSMLRIRMVEQAIASEYRFQQMRCPVHLSVGQEVGASAVCASLKSKDWVFSSHRSHAHYLAKGGNLPKMIAELFGKATGCSGGFGGSMHLTDLSSGFIGATPIVGSSIPIAVGAALTSKQRGLGSIVVAFLGDGAMETGVAHESMNFAAINRLPILFVCENNSYSVYSALSVRQPERKLCSIPESHGILAESIIGDDAEKVFQEAKDLIEHTRSEKRPAFLEIATYRWLEHCGPNQDDDLNYRPAEELASWKDRDPLARLENLINTKKRKELIARIGKEISLAFKFAQDSPVGIKDTIGKKVYAKNNHLPFTKDSNYLKPRKISFATALLEAQTYALESIDGTYLMGLGVPDPKGIFGSTSGLQRRFGNERVFDTPISENALTGVALGSAITGQRPILTHQRLDFALVSIDQIVNQAAKWHFMFGGAMCAPLVIRMIIGRGWGQGPQHSQALHSWFAHIPGLKVILPSTAYDAKGLLIAAIEDNNPVLFLEHRWLYEIVDDVPIGPYKLPLDKARVLLTGTDVTLVGISFMTLECVKAGEQLAKLGISAEVIDLRSVRPIDFETIILSVKKTGVLLIADHSSIPCGVSGEIATTITEALFHEMRSAPIRIGLPDHPVPTSHYLSSYYYPTSITISNAVLREFGRELEPIEGPEIRDNHDQPDPSFTGPF